MITRLNRPIRDQGSLIKKINKNLKIAFSSLSSEKCLENFTCKYCLLSTGCKVFFSQQYNYAKMCYINKPTQTFKIGKLNKF